MSETLGLLPHSSALAEALPTSLNILMSLDPEDPNFVSNLPRIIQAIRSEAEGRARAAELGKKAPKAIRASSGHATVSQGEASELDF